MYNNHFPNLAVYGPYPDTRFRSTWVLRIVRHPGYAGNILPLLGIVLALGSVPAIIPAVAALIITVIRTALEDRTLQEELHRKNYGRIFSESFTQAN